MSERIMFGFPEFWPVVYERFAAAFDALRVDAAMAQEILSAARAKMRGRAQFVIYMLVQMTATSLEELLILAGNGAGFGAMKLSRGMFESAVMAEYLRQTPREIHDYWDYRYVLLHKRLMQYNGEGISPERAAHIEANYQRVRTRFQNKDGNLRTQWHRKQIRQMAIAVGRQHQFELPYSIAASMHHGNFEAMLSHLGSDEENISFDEPPSHSWVKQALASGHVYLLQALDTLDTFLELGCAERIEKSGREFERVWKNHSFDT